MVWNRISNIIIRSLKYILALIFLSPFYIAFTYASKTKQEIAFTGLSFPKTIHFENFTRAIEMSGFYKALYNSVVTTIPTVIILTVICSMAAYIIARKNSRIYNIFYYLFLAALLIPFQSIMLPLYINLKDWGMLNSLTGFVLTRVGFQIAFTILVITGFVKSVPKEIEEAASIDGAGRFKTFWLVVFPLMKPIVFTSIVLNSLYTWNDFMISVVVLQKNDVRTLPLTQFFFFGENSIELNLAFAAFALSMIPILILYLVLQRYIISGITVGAVKG